MSAAAPCLTVLVLTEDGGEQAHATWETLLKKTFGVLVTGAQTHRIRFEPQSDREKAATSGNMWKSSNLRDQAKIVDLRRTIATKMLEADPPGFVVFHVDGDQPWSQRAQAENPRRFEEVLRAPVEALVRDRLAALERSGDIERVSKHLVLLVPCYEIEAWLYQSTDEVRKRCCQKPEHLARIEEWTANRAALDEEIRPKKEALPCIGDRHNEVLAKGFDADVVLSVGASYHAAVMHILEDAADLVGALERTAGGG